MKQTNIRLPSKNQHARIYRSSITCNKHSGVVPSSPEKGIKLTIKGIDRRKKLNKDVMLNTLDKAAKAHKLIITLLSSHMTYVLKNVGVESVAVNLPRRGWGVGKRLFNEA